jgi:hypothetical protein
LVSGGGNEPPPRRRGGEAGPRAQDFSTASLHLPVAPSPGGAAAIDVGAACACLADGGDVLRQGSLAAAAMDIIRGKSELWVWFVCVCGCLIENAGLWDELEKRAEVLIVLVLLCLPACGCVSLRETIRDAQNA